MKNIFLALLVTFSISTAIAQIKNHNFDWAETIKGTGDIWISEVLSDSERNIYFAGSYNGTFDFDPGNDVLEKTSQQLDPFIIKLDTAGNLLWFKTFSGNDIDDHTDFVIDSQDNLILAGNFSGRIDLDPGVGVNEVTHSSFFPGDGAFIVKLNSNGDFIWANTMNTEGESIIRSIKTDNTGAVFGTGSFSDKIDFGDVNNELTAQDGSDVFIFKYNADGSLAWGHSVENGGANDKGIDITTTASGDLVLLGRFSNTADFNLKANVNNISAGSGDSYFIMRTNGNGESEWVKVIEGAVSGFNPRAKVITINENAIISGNFKETIDVNGQENGGVISSNGEEDVFVLKLDEAGNYMSYNAFGSSGKDLLYGMTNGVDNQIIINGVYNGNMNVTNNANQIKTLTNEGNQDGFIMELSHLLKPTAIATFKSGSVDLSGNISGTASAFYISGNISNTTELNIFEHDQRNITSNQSTAYILRYSKFKTVFTNSQLSNNDTINSNGYTWHFSGTNNDNCIDNADIFQFDNLSMVGIEGDALKYDIPDNDTLFITFTSGNCENITPINVADTLKLKIRLLTTDYAYNQVRFGFFNTRKTVSNSRPIGPLDEYTNYELTFDTSYLNQLTNFNQIQGVYIIDDNQSYSKIDSMNLTWSSKIVQSTNSELSLNDTTQNGYLWQFDGVASDNCIDNKGIISGNGNSVINAENGILKVNQDPLDTIFFYFTTNNCDLITPISAVDSISIMLNGLTNNLSNSQNITLGLFEDTNKLSPPFNVDFSNTFNEFTIKFDQVAFNNVISFSDIKGFYIALKSDQQVESLETIWTYELEWVEMNWNTPELIGLSEINKIELLNIYPNPVKQSLNIYFDSSNEIVSIYNSIGKLMKTIPNLKEKVIIDVTDLPNGVYFIKKGSKSNTFIKK